MEKKIFFLTIFIIPIPPTGKQEGQTKFHYAAGEKVLYRQIEQSIEYKKSNAACDTLVTEFKWDLSIEVRTN